jgi:transcriptional regulator with XRE-family HTH domain
MTFADKLKELREKAGGVSEAALAEKSGVPFATIRNYAMGRRSPSFEAVLRLAAALGVTCEAFAGCEFPYEAQRSSAPLPTAPAKRRTGKMAQHPRKRPGKK